MTGLSYVGVEVKPFGSAADVAPPFDVGVVIPRNAPRDADGLPLVELWVRTRWDLTRVDTLPTSTDAAPEG